MVHSQSDLPEGEPSLLTTSVTVSDTTSPAHSPSKLQDPAFRILGKGDLVRIAERYILELSFPLLDFVNGD